ncbi:MAG: ACP S-malonyltransferase [Clostridiales bacterium]|nr:ACP S-malonyltransferase [Clostridiales bacterium]
MAKIAFVFSGQGSQYPGMGKSLYDNYKSVRELFDMAEGARPGTKEQCFAGSKEELTKTVNTQPCMYLTDLAAALALNEKGIFAESAAGFSLGEIAALAYGGAYGYTDGFNIVCRRGRIMSEAQTKEETAMGAVLKLDRDTVSGLCTEYDRLYAVNFNSAAQTVVSGLKSSVDEFAKKVKEIGGRFVPLAVSGAFHSPFMNDAAAKFASFLADYEIKKPDIPVYANYTAAPYGEVIPILTKQMNNPVRWQETIENMVSDGVDCFIEVGPGKTLTNLIKKITDKVAYSVENAESLEETVKAVKNNA